MNQDLILCRFCKLKLKVAKFEITAITGALWSKRFEQFMKLCWTRADNSQALSESTGQIASNYFETPPNSAKLSQTRIFFSKKWFFDEKFLALSSWFSAFLKCQRKIDNCFERQDIDHVSRKELFTARGPLCTIKGRSEISSLPKKGSKQVPRVWVNLFY